VADTLAPGEVLPLLRGRFGRPYRYAEVCPSTQRLFAAGDPEGAVAAAEEQTEGRGRLGRIWLAPPATSVLTSIVLVPQIAPERLPELSLVAGDAVARAIASETGVEPRVRFPNDVLIEGRKVAGILAEASGGRVVVGIGVNANQREDDLPVSAETTPTSLLLVTGSSVDRARLLATLLVELESAYDAWLSERGESG
jgi:BirA family biotin operon repressor/biotin-[acetyl-CoA-carboxylase] ligase